MRASPWILAARPATLWAGISPVVVGTSLAVDDGAYRGDVLVAALLVALSIQIGVNFANDLADARSGADDETRIGPIRAVASDLITPRVMARGVAAAFAVAAGAGMYLASVAGPVVLVLGAASFVAALGYTAGPFPYGYRGLGEVSVFIFFGLVATVGTRYVYDEAVTAPAWWAGVVMGLLATAILVANNVRDIDTDRAAGKRTLAVTLGRRRARWLYAVAVAGAFGTVVTGTVLEGLPGTALLMLLSIPLAFSPLRTVFSRIDGPALIAALKATARLQLVAGALLSLGFLM